MHSQYDLQDLHTLRDNLRAQSNEDLERRLAQPDAGGLDFCFELALRAGWWEDIATGELLVLTRTLATEKLMLVVTELAEAMEGHRKKAMDDKLPHYPMLWAELADAAIRLYDLTGRMGQMVRRGLTYPHSLDVPATLLSLCGQVSALSDRIHIAGRPSLSSTRRGPEPDLRRVPHSLEFGEVSQATLEILDMIYSLAGYAGAPDLDTIIAEKLRFNLTRKDYSLESRRAPNGKKL